MAVRRTLFAAVVAGSGGDAFTKGPSATSVVQGDHQLRGILPHGSMTAALILVPRKSGNFKISGFAWEWGRFDHPDQLSSYIGIVLSEHTSGQQRRQGAITKAGSTHARRLLIEASYHYRRHPGVGRALEERQRDQPPRSSPSPGQRNDAGTSAGVNSRTPARSPMASSRSGSPASSPDSAGRSPPGPIRTVFRRRPCQRATPSRRHAPSHRSPSTPSHNNRSTTLCGWRVGPRVPALRAQPVRGHPMSTRGIRPAALDFRQRTCDENKVLGSQPPHMRLTERREPRGAGPPRQPQSHL